MDPASIHIFPFGDGDLVCWWAVAEFDSPKIEPHDQARAEGGRCEDTSIITDLITHEDSTSQNNEEEEEEEEKS